MEWILFGFITLLCVFVSWRIWLLRPRGQSVATAESAEESSQNETKRGLPTPHDRIEIIEVSGPVRLYERCGHTAPSVATVDVYGDHRSATPEVQTCPECFLLRVSQLAIRCAFCRLPIMPGDPVALYGIKSEGLHMDVAVHIEDSVLGCMRWDCCPSGGFFAGHWTGKEFRPRFAGGTAVGEAFRTGKPIFGDIGPLEE